jgi:CRISPR-associated protein Cas1
MKKSLYIFNPMRMSRKDNTLQFSVYDEQGKEQKPVYRPVEAIESIYVFGNIDVNSALMNFLGQEQIPMHFFGYHENYTGSFMPKDYLLAGKVQIEQTKTYATIKKRLPLAHGFLEGATANMVRNLKYYKSRDRPALATQIEAMESYEQSMHNVKTIPELMGLEGNIRQTYYSAFDTIINDFEMGNRSRQPPSNEVNALISFGNMLCYTLALEAIFHTQLNPTISFLHEPGYRRYSLALDLAEIFKPILVDRVIFKVLNKKEIQRNDFDQKLNGCYLGKSGKQTFLRNWEERLAETIEVRELGKKVSYKYLVRLECYKILKYIMENEPYKPFKMNW